MITDPVELTQRVGALTLIAGGLAKGEDPISMGTVSLDENDDFVELAKAMKELLLGPYAGKEAEFFAEFLDIIADPPNNEKNPIEAIWIFVLSFEPAVRAIG
jgi:hypothetical protein